MRIFDMIEAKIREDRRKKMLEDAGKVVVGLTTGLAIGSTLGLLFAPKSGAETREDIKEFYGEQKIKMKEGYNKAVDKIGEEKARLIAGAKEKFDNVADKALEAAEDVVDKADEKVKEAKEKTEKAKEKVEEKKASK